MENTNKEVKKAKEVLEEISQDEHERYLTELREKYILDQKAIEDVGDMINEYNKGIQENIFNAGTIKKGTTVATANIETSSNYLGTLIGNGANNKTINGNYGNTTIEEMKSWDNATIIQNLGDTFKKNTNSNINQGLPILKWQ